MLLFLCLSCHFFGKTMKRLFFFFSFRDHLGTCCVVCILEVKDSHTLGLAKTDKELPLSGRPYLVECESDIIDMIFSNV